MVPNFVPKLLADSKSLKSQRTFAAIMSQKKPDFAAMQSAYDG